MIYSAWNFLTSCCGCRRKRDLTDRKSIRSDQETLARNIKKKCIYFLQEHQEIRHLQKAVGRRDSSYLEKKHIHQEKALELKKSIQDFALQLGISEKEVLENLGLKKSSSIERIDRYVLSLTLPQPVLTPVKTKPHPTAKTLRHRKLPKTMPIPITPPALDPTSEPALFAPTSLTKHEPAAYTLSTSNQGLENLGNTCFMNSLLNAFILYDQDFEKLLDIPVRQQRSESTQHFDYRTNLQLSLKNLKDELKKHSPNSDTIAAYLTEIRYNPLIQDIFPGNGQEDPHELFMVIHDQLNGEREYAAGMGISIGSHITAADGSHDYLYKVEGQPDFTTVFRPIAPRNVTEPLIGINNYSETNPTIQGCIDAFHNTELVDNPDNYHNFKGTKKPYHMRKYFVSSDPHKLVVPSKIRLQLPRFFNRKEVIETETKRGWGVFARKHKVVQVHYQREKLKSPIRESDRPFTIPIMDAKGERILANCRYQPIGIVRHSGSLGGGHYTAEVLKSDGLWYNFNDSYVSSGKDTPSGALDRECYLLNCRLIDVTDADGVPIILDE